RGLAGPAVADDQLALAAPDRDHRVDGLEPGLERLLHRPAVHDARGIPLDRPELLGVDRALAVHRLAERVDDAARQGLADRHLGDPVRALDDVAFLDELVVAEEHRADLVLLEVEDHPDDVAGELEQLTRHRLLEPVDAGDAVADLDDAPAPRAHQRRAAWPAAHAPGRGPRRRRRARGTRRRCRAGARRARARRRAPGSRV